MFEQLFERPHALARQRNGPLAEERRRYLVHCAEQQLSLRTYPFTVRHRFNPRYPDRTIIMETRPAGTGWRHSTKVQPLVYTPGSGTGSFAGELSRGLWASCQLRSVS
jgi:hypothetical protein